MFITPPFIDFGTGMLQIYWPHLDVIDSRAVCSFMRTVAAVPINSRVISNHNISVAVCKREIFKNTEPSILYLYQHTKCSVLYLWFFSQCWCCQVLKLKEGRHLSVLYAKRPHAAADCCTLTCDTVRAEHPMQGHDRNDPKTLSQKRECLPVLNGVGMGLVVGGTGRHSLQGWFAHL